MTDTPTEKPWMERQIDGAITAGEDLVESVDRNVGGSMEKHTKKIADNFSGLKPGEKETKESKANVESARGIIPWAAAGAITTIGFLFLQPIQWVTNKVFKGARSLVTGFGAFEKMPVLGGAFKFLGDSIEALGNVAGLAVPLIAGFLGYKAFKVKPEKNITTYTDTSTPIDEVLVNNSGLIGAMGVAGTAGLMAASKGDTLRLKGNFDEPTWNKLQGKLGSPAALTGHDTKILQQIIDEQRAAQVQKVLAHVERNILPKDSMAMNALRGVGNAAKNMGKSLPGVSTVIAGVETLQNVKAGTSNILFKATGSDFFTPARAAALYDPSMNSHAIQEARAYIDKHLGKWQPNVDDVHAAFAKHTGRTTAMPIGGQGFTEPEIAAKAKDGVKAAANKVKGAAVATGAAAEDLGKQVLGFDTDEPDAPRPAKPQAKPAAPAAAAPEEPKLKFTGNDEPVKTTGEPAKVASTPGANEPHGTPKPGTIELEGNTLKVPKADTGTAAPPPDVKATHFPGENPVGKIEPAGTPAAPKSGTTVVVNEPPPPAYKTSFINGGMPQSNTTITGPGIDIQQPTPGTPAPAAASNTPPPAAAGEAHASGTPVKAPATNLRTNLIGGGVGVAGGGVQGYFALRDLFSGNATLNVVDKPIETGQTIVNTANAGLGVTTTGAGLMQMAGKSVPVSLGSKLLKGNAVVAVATGGLKIANEDPEWRGWRTAEQVATTGGTLVLTGLGTAAGIASGTVLLPAVLVAGTGAALAYTGDQAIATAKEWSAAMEAVRKISEGNKDVKMGADGKIHGRSELAVTLNPYNGNRLNEIMEEEGVIRNTGNVRKNSDGEVVMDYRINEPAKEKVTDLSTYEQMKKMERALERQVAEMQKEYDDSNFLGILAIFYSSDRKAKWSNVAVNKASMEGALNELRVIMKPLRPESEIAAASSKMGDLGNLMGDAMIGSGLSAASAHKVSARFNPRE